MFIIVTSRPLSDRPTLHSFFELLLSQSHWAVLVKPVAERHRFFSWSAANTKHSVELRKLQTVFKCADLNCLIKLMVMSSSHRDFALWLCRRGQSGVKAVATAALSLSLYNLTLGYLSSCYSSVSLKGRCVANPPQVWLSQSATDKYHAHSSRLEQVEDQTSTWIIEWEPRSWRAFSVTVSTCQIWMVWIWMQCMTDALQAAPLTTFLKNSQFSSLQLVD